MGLVSRPLSSALCVKMGVVNLLNLFEDIGIPEDELHPKFKILRDVLNLTGEQEIIREWANGFIDRDDKIVKEFQTTFHSVFWEFYLFSVFKEAGFFIDFSKNRPDFIITNPYEINVEAVVSEIKQHGRKEDKRNLDDILSMVDPQHENENFKDFINEAITRYSNSIQNKKRKYLSEYSRCDWIKNDTPFVIALASYAQINYGKEFHYPLLALLYGYYFDPNTNSYNQLHEITKPETTSKIPIGIFRNEDMSDISAIVFSCTVTLGKLTSLSKSQNKSQLDLNHVINVRHDFEEPHFKIHDVSPNTPEELSDGLFVFHNPHARIKLPLEVFHDTNAIQVTIESGNLKFEGNNLPIVSRLNIPKLLLPEEIKNKFILEVFEKFNHGYKMSIFKVLEIDLLMNPKEVTLEDQATHLPVIMDLSEGDVDLINKNRINEGDIVSAIIKNELNEFGMNAIWRLVSIDKTHNKRMEKDRKKLRFSMPFTLNEK